MLEVPGAVPAPVAPSPVSADALSGVAWAPGQSRPLTEDQTTTWLERVTRAETKSKEYHPQWERGLSRYAKAKQPEAVADINALLDFRHVESKKAQLFYRTPEVNLLPKETGNPDLAIDQILPLRETFLNHDLGPSGANAKRAIQKTLIDTLAASGWMVTEIGYEDRKLPVPPDPMTGQPQLGLDGKPLQVPIWSRRFWEAVSSKKLLVPDDFYDTDFDKAPWLGIRGTTSVANARRMGWQIPEGFDGSTQQDEHRFEHGSPGETTGESKLEFVKIWYRATEFDEAVFNPELYRCLILVTGLELPAWHVDSPYQELTPEGQLTDDSMIGNPIHVGTLRDLTDSAYVPSDLTTGEQLSTEVNKFRTDLILNRNARKPLILIDGEGLDQTTISKIEKNKGPIVVPAGTLARGVQNVVAVVAQGTEPRDNYTAQDYAEKDWEQALGVSANQSGQFNKSKRTATEVRTVQGNSTARADTEKDRIREYFVAGVRKFDCLVQRTATEQELTKVLGRQGAQVWQQWTALPGRYAYDIQPDAGKHLDAQQDRAQALDEYNLLRKDPLTNAPELLKAVHRRLGYDPAKTVLPNQPEQKPDAPKISFSVGAQELSMPGVSALLLALLQQSGFKLPPEVGMLLAASAIPVGPVAPGGPTPPTPGQPAEHGGSADRTEPINQHQSERTGGVQGVTVQ